MIPRSGARGAREAGGLAGGLLAGRQNLSRIAGAFKYMKYLVGYSGGADSQVALDLALAKYDDVEIIFIDTSIEFPETLDMMLETARFYGLEIKVLRAGKTFEEYLDDFGGMYPSWRRRWCQDRLKERPLKRYINTLIRRGLRHDAQETAGGSSRLAAPHRPVTVIDGIRSDESSARKKRNPLEPHKSGKWDIEHIIFSWTKPEVFEYIRTHGLPLNPLYSMGYSRTSCWFCPFKPKADNQILRKLHPELYEKALEWASRYGRRFCYPVEDQPDSDSL
jgi:phosphoadenosine phosphosulfate reductase